MLFSVTEDGKPFFDVLNHKFERMWFGGNGYGSVFEQKILELQFNFIRFRQERKCLEEKEYVEFFIKNMVMLFLGNEYEVVGNIQSIGEFNYETIDSCFSHLGGIQQFGLQGTADRPDDRKRGEEYILLEVTMMVNSFSDRSLTIKKAAGVSDE